MTRAVQVPRGALTSTSSPARAPISASPSGAVGETAPGLVRFEISIVSRLPFGSSISTIDPTETISWSAT